MHLLNIPTDHEDVMFYRLRLKCPVSGLVEHGRVNNQYISICSFSSVRLPVMLSINLHMVNSLGIWYICVHIPNDLWQMICHSHFLSLSPITLSFVSGLL